MISNELLSKVLRCKIIIIKLLHKDYIHFNQTENEIELQYINIYELAHKCKEWVNLFPTWADNYAGRQKGIFMEVMPIERDNKTIYYSRICYKNYNVIMPNSEFTADTEPEAIFKACEWIVEQTKGLKWK